MAYCIFNIFNNILVENCICCFLFSFKGTGKMIEAMHFCSRCYRSKSGSRNLFLIDAEKCKGDSTMLQPIQKWPAFEPVRPMARWMTQHGGLLGLLEESFSPGWNLCCDGRSMPLPDGPYRLPYSGAAQLWASGKSSCCCWCSSILNVHKTPSSNFITQGRHGSKL
jgi:hypothetical protein